MFGCSVSTHTNLYISVDSTFGSEYSQNSKTVHYHVGLQIVKCKKESAEDEEVLEIGEFCKVG